MREGAVVPGGHLRVPEEGEADDGVAAVGPAGWEIAIKTQVDSEGMVFDTTDPAMKPLLLQLARGTAAQFLEELNGMLVKAGSATRIAVGDPERSAGGDARRPRHLSSAGAGLRSERRRQVGETRTLPGGVDLALVYIPEGSFFMGSADGIGDPESQPQERVAILRAFWLGKHELTQAQWIAVMQANPSKSKGNDLPVDSVTWHDGSEFLDALNRNLGLAGEQTFRLPTEAEWEYGARAGTTTHYSFSNSGKDLGGYAWFDKSSSGIVHPVGRLRPNPWACTTCTATSRSGARTPGTTTTRPVPSMAALGGARARTGFTGEATSARPRRTCVRTPARARTPPQGARTIGLRLAVPALHAQSGRPTAPVFTGITPGDAAAPTPVHSGTLPQPEPDCTLNAEQEVNAERHVAAASTWRWSTFPRAAFSWFGEGRPGPAVAGRQHEVTISRPFSIGEARVDAGQ